MLIYLGCFTLTLLLVFLDEWLWKKYPQNKKLIILCSFFVILIPSILAGVRDDTVGTDVLVYCKPWFDMACQYDSLWSYIQSIPGTEWGYLACSYFVSRFTNDSHWVYFLYSFLVSLFVFLSLYEVREEGSVFLGEFVYLFMFYNMSYNIIRQSIAMALLLYATVKFGKREYIKTIVLCIVACSFHRTAFIAFPIFALFKIFHQEQNFNRKRERYKNICFLSIIVGAVLIGEVYLDNIVHLLIRTGILTEKFLEYLSGKAGQMGVDGFIVYVMGYLIVVMNRNRVKNGYAFFCIALLDILLYFLLLRMKWLYRISCYYMFYRIFSFSRIKLSADTFEAGSDEEGEKTKRFNRLLFIYCILICVISWSEDYFLLEKHGTADYTSAILGIYK